MSNELANWIIAGAAVANVLVYVGLWHETRKQIALARELFLESHAPALSVAIEGCAYSGTSAKFSGHITIANNGSTAARDVTFEVPFNTVGFERVKKIGPVVIQPKGALRESFSYDMSVQTYNVGQLDGNRLRTVIQGSYKGLGSSEYRYNEIQEFNNELGRFVAIWASA
jgi:hypothetical protein